MSGSVFGSFYGLPVHTLVVHAAVVLTPLAALLGLAFLRPAWRMPLRWPLAGATALATIAVYVARQSGEVLKDALGDQIRGNVTGAVVDRHEELANRLWIWLLVMVVATVVVALLLPRLGNPLVGGGLALGLAALAVIVTVLVVQTGEAGAKARWNPDGSFDYSGSTG